jgi:hypothetical protein
MCATISRSGSPFYDFLSTPNPVPVRPVSQCTWISTGFSVFYVYIFEQWIVKRIDKREKSLFPQFSQQNGTQEAVLQFKVSNLDFKGPAFIHCLNHVVLLITWKRSPYYIMRSEICLELPILRGDIFILCSYSLQLCNGWGLFIGTTILHNITVYAEIIYLLIWELNFRIMPSFSQ